MKKILVLLLVLAVAGGVFAQDGEWNLSGKAEIGAFLNFKTDPILSIGQGYFQPYDWWGPLNGRLGIGYNREALSLGVEINNNDGDPIGGDLQYDAGNYKFQAATNLARLMNNNVGSVGRLWGYYKMLNELIHLEVAYNSRDTEFWVSDKTGAFQGGDVQSPAWPGGDTFTKVDHHNYLLTSVELENLSFGVMLPNIFGASGTESTTQFPGALAGDPPKNNAYSLFDDVLKKLIIGFTFNMQPVEVAGQFQMGNYGVYFGGKWFVGPVTVGISFTGILDPKSDKLMKFGGGIEYNPGAFGAAVKAFYGLNTVSGKSIIGVEPNFFYNVIPTHLQFSTDVGFYFTKGVKGADLDITWAVQPFFLGRTCVDNFSFFL